MERTGTSTAGNKYLAANKHRPVNARDALSGFTLLELVLVLLLLGLAYGLTGPMLGETPAGVEIRTATRQLSAGLRKARNVAIAERRDVQLTLDVEARTFSVSSDPRVYSLPRPLDYSLYTATSEVSRTNAGSIRFFSDGSSTGGRISIGIAGGTTQIVEVDWLTGRVRAL